MNVYEIITDRIVKMLEAGTIPWRKPWVGDAYAPKNLASKKEYRGINTFLLSCQQFSSPYWLTYKQAQELKGNVKKGEHGSPVVFWKWLEKENDKGEEEKIPLLRYYTVFNVAQCEGITAPEIAKPVNTFSPIEDCDRIVNGMPKRPEIRHGMTGAFYRPADDMVGMPEKASFIKPQEYYSTLFHELGHSTGHASRVGRPGVSGISMFGSRDYSKEELVAEMTAAFLCGTAGIECATIDNSAAYVAGWLKRLKDDSKAVVFAAAQAQKAADFILDKKAHEEG